MQRPALCICENFFDPESCELVIRAFKNIAKADADGKRGWTRNMPLRTEISAGVFKRADETSAFHLISRLRKRIVKKVSGYFDTLPVYPEYTLVTNNRPGDKHVLHADAEKLIGDSWVPNHTPQRSHTGMLYLNSGGGKDYSGGEIDFPNLQKAIIPSAGLLVGFKTTHEYIHQVFPILKGQRFAISLWMTQNISKSEQW